MFSSLSATHAYNMLKDEWTGVKEKFWNIVIRILHLWIVQASCEMLLIKKGIHPTSAT